MNNIIVKVTDGELYNFFDSDTKNSFIIGSKRSCDLVVKSSLVAPEQLRCLCKDGVWYVEDLTPDGFKSEVLIGGKRFKRPIVKFDNEIIIRKEGDRKSKDFITISLVRKISRRRTGSKVDLSAKTVTVVGRNPSCDIVVDNPKVSERHFHIINDGKCCYIEDLHSINGTFVNNRKIRRAKLNDYDRISIPAAAYTFYDKKLLFSTSPAGIQIDVAGVCKEVSDRHSRGKIKLVSNVSFRIKAGDFVAIVGGSGTGKSTMLDCINGIRPATAGAIYYDTNNYYENIKAYKEIIGYVPQKDIMHDDLTVEEGLFYTAMLRMRSSMFKDEVKARVRQAIEDVSLTGREKVKISSLSGGQRKRVSIAMELLSEPKVIFLDEPTSGLSPDLDLEMMELLKELASKGRTIVVITHAMENLDKCDKIAFLGRGGKLCFYGDHKDIFRYFNRKSYSRIFAALSDEKICDYFEHKYRSTEYYKKLYASFIAQYGDSGGTILPPAERKKATKTRRDKSETEIENVSEFTETVQPSTSESNGIFGYDYPSDDDRPYTDADFAADTESETTSETLFDDKNYEAGSVTDYVAASVRRRGGRISAGGFDVIPDDTATASDSTVTPEENGTGSNFGDEIGKDGTPAKTDETENAEQSAQEVSAKDNAAAPKTRKPKSGARKKTATTKKEETPNEEDAAKTQSDISDGQDDKAKTEKGGNAK